MKKSNKILIAILAFILTCFIGYALFSETVVVSGTLNASGNFRFEATCMNGLDEANYRYVNEMLSTDIGGLKPIEGGYENEYCKTSGDTVSFGANLKYPTAVKFYTIYLENTGTIDAIYDEDNIDMTIKNCVDYNGDGVAEEKCDSSGIQFSIVYPLSIIHNGKQCIMELGECGDLRIEDDDPKTDENIYLIPSGAKLGVLAAARWASFLDDNDDNNGNLIKMDTTVKFNFEQVKN